MRTLSYILGSVSTACLIYGLAVGSGYITIVSILSIVMWAINNELAD